MSFSQLEDEIVEYVDKHPGTSFVEIERILAKHSIPTKGLKELALDEYNIVIWSHMSDEFINIMQELDEKQRIYRHPSAALIYYIDGLVPGLPLATRARKYAKPHWAPVTFYTYPHPSMRR